MMIWNSIDELLPGDSRPVLLSFQGYNTPMIGYCVCDENGTTFYTYDGVPCLNNDLYVNAWMELPTGYNESYINTCTDEELMQQYAHVRVYDIAKNTEGRVEYQCIVNEIVHRFCENKGIKEYA